MANTYTRLYIQIVFAVQGRQSLIQTSWKNDLNKYISGTITNLGHKSINVNGMPDHIHAFVGLHPSTAISDLVREIKTSSTQFINENNLIKGKFNWQSGYGAFSYSQSQISQVYEYIANQEIHHKKKTFKDEYLEFLKEFDIAFDDKYLFDFLDF
jgi:putative transposase